MEKLEIKLNQFRKNELKQRKLKSLLGGDDPNDSGGLGCYVCSCKCTASTLNDFPIETHINTATIPLDMNW